MDTHGLTTAKRMQQNTGAKCWNRWGLRSGACILFAVFAFFFIKFRGATPNRFGKTSGHRIGQQGVRRVKLALQHLATAVLEAKLGFGLWWWSRQQAGQMFGASAFGQLMEEVLGGTHMDALKTKTSKHHQHRHGRRETQTRQCSIYVETIYNLSIDIDL